MGLRLFNTASRNLEDFVPLSPSEVTMYNCGPTVYNFAHIGNLRPYVFADVLRRTLESSGYKVKQVVNITDVGHLVGDGDEGEDKMTAALKREGKPLTKEAMREVGDKYTAAFVDDLHALNIQDPTVLPKASDHIPEDIELVSLLLKKGHAYPTSDGVYFDTNTFPDYAKFAQLDLAGMKAGARVDVGEKRNPSDFAIWKFNDVLGYDAPFGKGFPGWHIECSAMIHKHLGHPIDIHTGGVDHIPVHHTNEIAQSESAYGKPFVNYWMHCAHMMVDGEKISKSLGNGFTLKDLKDNGISPLAYRYWLLMGSYRTQMNFTWDAVSGAKTSYDRLLQDIFDLGSEMGTPHPDFLEIFMEHVANDLNTSQALVTLRLVINDNTITSADKRATIAAMDQVLGLKLLEYKPEEVIITPQLESLLNAREKARAEKNWTESDRVRDAIKALGFDVKDTPEGQKLERP